MAEVTVPVDSQMETQLTPQMAEPVVPTTEEEPAATLPAEMAEQDENSILELDAICKKCLQPVVPSEAVVKAPKVLWCRECNSIYSMLRRHQQWPPACFNGLSAENQAEFWSRCKKERKWIFLQLQARERCACAHHHRIQVQGETFGCGRDLLTA